MTKKVYVCFLRADSNLLEKHVLNQAASYFAPTLENEQPMVHSEIFFPSFDDTSSVIGKSCGIHYGGQVFVSQKRFTKKNWIFRAFTCSDEQYSDMTAFCDGQRGGEFNYMGYFTPCGPSMQARLQAEGPQRWYCSELCSAVLHKGKIVDALENPIMHAHPHSLYNVTLGFTFADCGRNLNSQCLEI